MTKMDNFKSLSVGAAEWLDIEEVNEEVSTDFCTTINCVLNSSVHYGSESQMIYTVNLPRSVLKILS